MAAILQMAAPNIFSQRNISISTSLTFFSEESTQYSNGLTWIKTDYTPSLAMLTKFYDAIWYHQGSLFGSNVISVWAIAPPGPMKLARGRRVWVNKTQRTINKKYYNDVIINAMASKITGVLIVYSAVCSGADERKHESSASLAFVRGIHRWPVNSLHKRSETGKCFHLMTSSWKGATQSREHILWFNSLLSGNANVRQWAG